MGWERRDAGKPLRAAQSSTFSMKEEKELNSDTAQEGEAALRFGWTLKHSPASSTRFYGVALSGPRAHPVFPTRAFSLPPSPGELMLELSSDSVLRDPSLSFHGVTSPQVGREGTV